MVNVYKRRRKMFVKEEDRISNLPLEVMELILEELSVQDAARTIILSKTWRYRWTRLFRHIVNDDDNNNNNNKKKKRTFVSCGEDDVISKLPQQFIELILDRLPVQDAARTSVLSKTWRYTWTSMNALLFSKHLSRFKMMLLQQGGCFTHLGRNNNDDNNNNINSSFFTQLFMVETIPKCPTLLLFNNRLKRLDLLDINFGDLDQLHGVLCMLRNTPNLEQLWVRNQHYMGWEDMHFNLEPALLSCFQTATDDCLDFTLSRLQRVTFMHTESTKAEMLFIKLLLNHSTALKRLIIHPRISHDDDVEYDFDSNEKVSDVLSVILRFPRVASKLQVHYITPGQWDDGIDWDKDWDENEQDQDSDTEF